MVKTAQELKASITPERIAVATKLFLAMAAVETIRPIVEGYQNKVLKSREWHIIEKWQKIEGKATIDNIKDTYLMDDLEHEEYSKLLDIEKEKAGFIGLNPGYCPLLMAESARINAEHDLFDAMEPVFGFNGKNITLMKDRNKLLTDILLPMFAPHVKKAVSK